MRNLTKQYCVPNANEKLDQVFQFSTMVSLLDGIYDGDFYMSEAKKIGDFGIGTFNQLDGELIGFDGAFYRLRSDGQAYPVKGSDCSPFCSLTYFTPDIYQEINQPMSSKDFENKMQLIFPSENLFYAIRMEGVFKKVKTRTVEIQEKPYMPMTEAVKSQPIFEFNDIKGTIVGFWTPHYVNGVAVSGFHLHFIDEHRRSGGHVFNYEIEKCTVQMSQKSSMHLRLPNTKDFFKANLDKHDLVTGIEATEGDPE
ncbi:acetolactate decarboxylase [Virgibacillus chiguensis]|uniref:Alpha-acetolactate decarboxylase n=1 Tax=Virgibacillus chiguensis TaxID=411959 RepID=A0A1M5TV29_9BACI|nr:acetolactate decarboxylase [Virgibacillus chiguensis]SHH54642.1 acetolactate decarboxylase [Virgibacillus chiguensis]